jgi:hypothetical protein
MTTTLAHEPRPGDGLVPHMSTLADRLYRRLPEIYRHLDGRDATWTFKRYLAGLTGVAGEVDDVVERIRGERPVGPALPEPWSLSPDELELWRAARRTRASALGDPLQADAAWLPWLAQLVGARLDPGASETEQRDTIRYATSGWRGGTRAAIADAARTALTGGRYARVVPHTVPGGSGGITAGTVWDITIVTRVSETPDPGAVLGAVLRKGVKPAGAVLWHAAYEATWDQQEAVYPTWYLRDAATWDQLAEAGLVYRAVPGNLLTNPSFEVDAAGWSGRGAISTVGRVAGGLDGAGMGRVTVSADGTGEVFTPQAAVTPGDYNVSVSVRPDQTRDVVLAVDWLDAGNVLLSTQTMTETAVPADTWRRVGGVYTAPASAATARPYVQVTGMLSAETYDLDAAFMRRVP